MKSEAHAIVDFLRLSERLKFELRHSWLSNGRQESVAEHTWQMALLACLAHPHLSQPVSLEKTLKMILIHDLVEAIAGDVPFFESGERKEKKREKEEAAIEQIRDLITEPVGQEFFELWHEFENRETAEAKFAAALDHLEVQCQHNLADLSTWEPIEYELLHTKMDPHCEHEPFLKTLCDVVKEQGVNKIEKQPAV